MKPSARWTALDQALDLVGSLKHKPGLLRIDRAAAAREAHYDVKWLLRTSDFTLTAEDLASA